MGMATTDHDHGGFPNPRPRARLFAFFFSFDHSSFLRVPESPQVLVIPLRFVESALSFRCFENSRNTEIPETQFSSPEPHGHDPLREHGAKGQLAIGSFTHSTPTLSACG